MGCGKSRPVAKRDARTYESLPNTFSEVEDTIAATQGKEKAHQTTMALQEALQLRSTERGNPRCRETDHASRANALHTTYCPVCKESVDVDEIIRASKNAIEKPANE